MYERKKPDLFISGGQGLRDIVADVRICLPTHINDAISRQEAEENYKRHATEAFNNKINKHGAAAETNDYDLLPMIMTTTGLLHDRFKDYITRTVKRMAPDRGKLKKYLQLTEKISTRHKKNLSLLTTRRNYKKKQATTT